MYDILEQTISHPIVPPLKICIILVLLPCILRAYSVCWITAKTMQSGIVVLATIFASISQDSLSLHFCHITTATCGTCATWAMMKGVHWDFQRSVSSYCFSIYRFSCLCSVLLVEGLCPAGFGLPPCNLIKINSLNLVLVLKEALNRMLSTKKEIK